MAQDIAQELLDAKSELASHPLENLCMPTPGTFPTINKTTQEKLVKLLEVYIDDFVGLLQAPSVAQAQKFTRAILHDIHTIFAPPDASNHNDESIALKKLAQGDGVWAT